MLKKPRINRSIIVLTILSLAAAGIHLYAANAQNVETWYAGKLYPGIASFFRTALGTVPFSVGDLLYATAFLFLVWKIMRLIFLWRKKRISRTGITSRIPALLIVLLSVYILFNILWGLNYNRPGIHEQMGFERNRYSKEELIEINRLLLQEVNTCKSAISRHPAPYPSSKELFSKTADVYNRVAQQYPLFIYKNVSVKPTLFGWLGNYLGFSGYYNPLTGEAQVNTQIPVFTQPYVACHEIAHQLGYAKENEANFVGYIVATASGDPQFMYSAYFDLFLYANRSLYHTDSVTAIMLMQQLAPAVKEDLTTLRQYYKKYENPVEPVIRWAYGKYLEANSQPMGMLSYSEVVADLIGYYKKYGKVGGG
ncbi:MAG: DUF3810 domain-containing protein [Chitinophagaceae bacterium]|nr:DUF3810 domain-containing protein [Chitinophagaceae bacterium]